MLAFVGFIQVLYDWGPLLPLDMHFMFSFIYLFTFLDQVFQLLNSDDHAHFLKRNNKDPAAYRPDILHQVSFMCIFPVLNEIILFVYALTWRLLNCQI